MPHDALACESCHMMLPPSIANRGEPARCPRCDTLFTVDVFPAAFRTADDTGGSDTLVDSEAASCFVHGDRKAVTSCTRCGKFLCRLCDVSLLGGHYCTGCLESLRNDPSGASVLTSGYLRWEVLALLLTLFCFLLSPFVFVLSPAALVFAILGWRAPRGPVGHPRRRAGMLIALHLALTGLMLSFIVFGILSGLGVLE